MAVALAATAIGALALGSLLTTSQGCRPANTPTVAASATPMPDDTSPALLPSPPPQQTEEPSPGAPRKVTVFKVIEGENGDSRLENVEIELTGAQAKAPAGAALEAMVGEKDSPLPPGTRVRSVKIGADKVATVDFSQEFVKNFPGGDKEEALVLNAVTGLLGQFPTVKQVQILVEGKKIDTLGGNQDLDVPLLTPQANKAGAASGAPDEHTPAEGAGEG